MNTPQPLCTCEICLSPEPELAVTPTPTLNAIRNRVTRQSPGRDRCPRCGELLGCTEVVVDGVGYAHFVQPCFFCLALWVL